jgi:Holliday junction DNA helicase RuvA
LIAHLAGKLIEKEPGRIVLDVSGVGYEATIPLSTFYEIGDIGSDLSLIIHTHVREDALQLFGFRTAAEKELFLKLTSVSGIGPKLAIGILSGLPAAELISAITGNNLARLTAIPGVGRKTAERLVVELRDKVSSIATGRPAEASAAKAAAATQSALYDDTVAALTGLGYAKPLAERAVTTILGEEGDKTIEAVLRRALKLLSR